MNTTTQNSPTKQFGIVENSRPTLLSNDFDSIIDNQKKIGSEYSNILVNNIESIKDSSDSIKNLISFLNKIDTPVLDFETAVSNANYLYTKVSDLQLKVEKNNYDLLATKQKKNAEARLENIRSNITKTIEKEKKEVEEKNARNVSFGFSVLGFLLGLACAALAVFSGGSTLVLGITVMSAVFSTISFGGSVADKVYDDTNAKELDLFGQERKKSASFGRLCAQIEENNRRALEPNKDFKNLSESEKTELRKTINGVEQRVNAAFTVLSMIIAVAGLAVSITSFTQIGKDLLTKLMPKIIKDVAKDAAKASTDEIVKSVTEEAVNSIQATLQVADVAATIATETSNMAGAIIGLQLADSRFEMKSLDNQLKLLRAFDDYIDTHINLAMDEINKISQRIEDDSEHAANLLKQINQSQGQIQKRI